MRHIYVRLTKLGYVENLTLLFVLLQSKLESYKDLQKSGKDLNQDQKTAIAKYDEVITTLDFARDLCKQFLSIAVVSEKDDKKKARKEAFARSQAELTKVNTQCFHGKTIDLLEYCLSRSVKYY